MRITKDEARILSLALEDAKYTISDGRYIDGLFESLFDLEKRLDDAGKDQRRTGRKSQDDMHDVMKRFVASYNKSATNEDVHE